ncbi:hypothetical protein [Mycobacterium sp. 1245852.3]|uniref:hypothetical protein n=1 Tax=Mycobacterium sp. 1245852.3 TaxID=1856860 RepID=UPI0007FCE69C|nr:hypothetical protein [Mycobacterium sp. 1245852.3]OBJ86973.1 hypothetical protein A9W96_02360 [Mycobacterium sp. 1245852.3]
MDYYSPTEWLEFTRIDKCWALGDGWWAVALVDQLGRGSLRMVDDAELEYLRSGRRGMREFPQVSQIDREGPLRLGLQVRVDRVTAKR